MLFMISKDSESSLIRKRGLLHNFEVITKELVLGLAKCQRSIVSHLKSLKK